MSKKAVCILFGCLIVLFAITIAVVASIASSREEEGTERNKKKTIFSIQGSEDYSF